MITNAKMILKICELYRVKQSTQRVSEILGISESSVKQVINNWFEQESENEFITGNATTWFSRL